MKKINQLLLTASILLTGVGALTSSLAQNDVTILCEKLSPFMVDKESESGDSNWLTKKKVVIGKSCDLAEWNKQKGKDQEKVSVVIEDKEDQDRFTCSKVRVANENFVVASGCEKYQDPDAESDKKSSKQPESPSAEAKPADAQPADAQPAE